MSSIRVLPKGAVPINEYIRKRLRASEQPDYVGILVQQIVGAGLHAVMEREYKFHPTRRWLMDLALFKNRFRDPFWAVEIEGGLWAAQNSPAKRAHAMPLAIVRDIEKYNEEALLGWRVLRLLPEWIASPQGSWRSEALALVEQALRWE